MDEITKIENKEEIDFIKDKLKLNAVNFLNPYKTESSPFIQTSLNELLIEINGNLTDNYDNIIRVVKSKEQDLYLMKLNDSNKYVSSEIYKISNNIDKDTFWEEGFNIGYNIQGIPFYIFDLSFTWCIHTNSEIRFITGDADFFNQYYTDEKIKIKELQILLSDFYDSTITCPKSIIKTVKFKLNGVWINDVEKWWKGMKV